VTNEERAPATVERKTVALRDVNVEIFVGGPMSGPMVCASHPADTFDAGTVELVAGTVHARVACVNPNGLSGPAAAEVASLDQMVDRIEASRRELACGRWVFWGMSGGGWLAQIYAHRYPESLAGIVVESACPCFRERLADPACVLSPRFPAWQAPLRAAGLYSEQAHSEPWPGEDTEWLTVDGVGEVFRRRQGPALLVSPGPLTSAMKRVMPRLWEFDSRAWIRTIRVPTLVLCGSADPVVPVRHARAVHEAIAGSLFVEVPGAGHVPLAEKRPEVATTFAGFVSALPPGAWRDGPDR